LSGSYSAGIYIPLPPPVSFLGINLAFNVDFSISVTLYGKSTTSTVQCTYNFEVGANAGTAVKVGASAAVRAVVI
jgi:hypothetical protein